MPCSCKQGARTALQLIDKDRVNPTTYSFKFAPIEPLKWKEGDSSALVVQVSSLGMEDSRKLSYASLPSEKIVQFTTRIKGRPSLFKQELKALELGDFVEITYPEGGFSLLRHGRPALLLSNGVGVATMRGLVKAFEENQTDIGCMTQINIDATGAIFRDEFEGLSMKNPAFKSIYIDHRDTFYRTVENEVRDLMFASGMMPYFYIVGSDDFIASSQNYLLANGFTDQDIVTDTQGCGCSSTKIKKVHAQGRVKLSRPIRLQ